MAVPTNKNTDKSTTNTGYLKEGDIHCGSHTKAAERFIAPTRLGNVRPDARVDLPFKYYRLHRLIKRVKRLI